MAEAYRDTPAFARSGRTVQLGWWRDAAMRLLARINQHRVLLIAAGVSFYLLLSMVPTLTLLVSLYGLFNDRATVSQHVGLLSGIVPEGGLHIIEDQLARLTSTPPSALSLTLVASLLVALWSASAGVKALFDAMNIAHEEEEHRNFFVLNGLALLFTLCGVLAAVVAIGAVVVIPAVLNVFFPGQGFDWLVTLLGYVVMLAVLVLGVGALYRWGPSSHHGRWRWISPGTLLTIVATIVVSVLFSWYAANFGNYNAAYGSLGALVGMMTWLWLTMTVLIIGAELNAESERSSAAAAGSGNASPALSSQPPRRVNFLRLALALPAVALLAWAERRGQPHR